jgi:hypothetical protein
VNKVMKQKALALITTGAIILTAASPAFAGGRHHNHRKHNRNISNNSISQSIKLFQKGYKNIAKISANINFGGW